MDIPIPHEVSTEELMRAKDKDGSNYFPLDDEQLAEIIDFAKAYQDGGLPVWKVQIRLSQAIPGMVV